MATSKVLGLVTLAYSEVLDLEGEGTVRERVVNAAWTLFRVEHPELAARHAASWWAAVESGTWGYEVTLYGGAV